MTKQAVRKKWIAFIICNFILIFLDQITKYLARTKLDRVEGIDLIPGILKLQYLENRGAAFGFMQNQLAFFIICTLLIFAVLLFLYYKLPENPRFLPIRYCLLGLSAGALGNFIDRILFNYVTDFLYFELINFPIFNVADCYVTLSAVFFLLLAFFYYKDADWEVLEDIVKKNSK